MRIFWSGLFFPDLFLIFSLEEKMKQLSEVEPEIEIEVKRIDGGSEVTGYLREVGSAEGNDKIY